MKKFPIMWMLPVATLALLAAALPAYPAELQTDLTGIVAGTIKHPKKLTLSPTDIADVAAYISGNEPK